MLVYFCGSVCAFRGRSLRNRCVVLFLWLYLWQVFEKPVCWFIFMVVSVVSVAGLLLILYIQRQRYGEGGYQTRRKSCKYFVKSVVYCGISLALLVLCVK